MNASFAAHMPREGKLALRIPERCNMSRPCWICLEREHGFPPLPEHRIHARCGFRDLIDYLGSDYEVGSILLYIESLTNFRKS